MARRRLRLPAFLRAARQTLPVVAATPLAGGSTTLERVDPTRGIRGLDWLPALFFSLAALPFVAQVLGTDPTILTALRVVLPVGVAAPDRVIALLSATALAALALGLHRRKQLAWRLATLTLVAGLLEHLMFSPRPIALLIGGAALLALAIDRRRYGAESPDGWAHNVTWIMAIAALAVAVEALLAVHNFTQDVRIDIRGVVLAVASWASFGDRWLPYRHGISPLGLLPSISARLMAWIAILGSLRPAGPPRLNRVVADHARAVLRRFGSGPLLPFQLAEGIGLYADADRDAAVAYGHSGRSVVVLGDPIGPAGDAWATFRSFVAACERRDEVVMVYQASGESRHSLLEAGFNLFRVGQEAVIQLAAFSLAGSRRANLRHTVTRAKRGGIEIRWLPDGLPDGAEPELRAAMATVDGTWTAAHPGDLGFTIGRFDPAHLDGVAMAIAVTPTGAVDGFATFRHTGADAGYVLDLMRRAPGGVPGALESCLAEAAERLRDAGASYLSLGLAPLAGLSKDEGPMEERLLARAAEVAGPAYDVAGLAFFKRKFDPLWVPRYGAVRHRRDLPAYAMALLSLHVGGIQGTIATAASLARSRPRDLPVAAGAGGSPSSGDRPAA